MKEKFAIKEVHSREVFYRQEFSGLGQPAVETTIVTEGGSMGTAIAAGGFSVGKHESSFLYDKESRWRGKGVLKAVNNVNSIIAPKIIGMNVAEQGEIDTILINLDGTGNKSRLGGNAIASVSEAVLKAAANSYDLPLYRYIGGVNANILPVPGTICVDGSRRYGSGERGGGKPSYALVCYGFSTFSEAAYACWETQQEISKKLIEKFGDIPQISGCYRLNAGFITHDRDIWEIMTKSVDDVGYNRKIGLQVDIAAGSFYNNKDEYEGLFSKDKKSKEDLLELYLEMVETYPFMILEDPFHEDDFSSHSVLTKETDVQIVGDDLFVTNIKRLKKGVETGACNAILLKIPQVGTVTEAFNVVNYAYKKGYSVMPCSSRGEGIDIADFSVGLNAGQIREGGIGPTANRLIKIENELGSNSKFLGRDSLKVNKY